MMVRRIFFYAPITLSIVTWLVQGESIAGEGRGSPYPEAASGNNRGSGGDDKLGRRFGRFMGSFMDEMDKNSSHETNAPTERYGQGRPDERSGYPSSHPGGFRQEYGDREPPRYRDTGRFGSDDDERTPHARRPRSDNRDRMEEQEWERERHRYTVPNYDPWGGGVPYRGYTGYRGYGYDPYLYDPWGGYQVPDLDGYGSGYPVWGSPYAAPGWGAWGVDPIDPLVHDSWQQGNGWFQPGRGRWQGLDPFSGAPWGWGGGSWFW
ncbi:MAG: hypothetical protein HQL64_10215 [Magnetococcales bacterium]|nr:hypothetical protein [Magnetococcales bacterium]